MVLRIKKRSRKYLGSRRWGSGNIKNNRGAGDRGGVGKAGKKHKLTRLLVYDRGSLKSQKGFFSHKKRQLIEINLRELDKRIGKQGANATIELEGYKVLGSGKLTAPAIIKASAFSARASQKIESAGGKALVMGKQAGAGTAETSGKPQD
ncbi:MAG: uL15m family ribosomal protein [Candidatus Micrarchaeaceae archaeon]